jgi:hypothetical protein
MSPRTLLLGLALVLRAASPAWALIGSTDGPAGLDGSIRSIGAGIDYYHFPPFFGDVSAEALSQTLLRLVAAGRPRPWLAYELHGVQTLTYRTGDVAPIGTAAFAPFSLVATDLRYRALDATHEWTDRPHLVATLFPDRANVRLTAADVDLTVGRQAITLGKTYLWNPLDVFLPFDPQQFDQEYKPGVDAVRLDVPLGAFSGIGVIGAAGRSDDAGGGQTLDASWTESAVLGRAFATVRGWDLAVQGGKVFGGYHVGAGATGEIGPLETRVELARQIADADIPLLPGVPDSGRLVEDGTTAVVGVGHRFESTLTLEAEWFANGLGDAAHLDAALVRFARGATLGLSDHLLGLVVAYDILPVLVGQLGWLVAPEDPSAQVLPRLTWSAGDEVEVLAGAIANLGARPALTAERLRVESEFGTFPDVYYVELKFYF